MNRREVAVFALAALAAPVGVNEAAAKGPPANWDGLVRASSKRLDYVYLLPGADFRGYKSVLLDPTQVAFEKDWKRDYNNTTARGLSGRISDSDIEDAVTRASKAATDVFAKAFAAGGYPIAAAPADGVLRVSTALVNVRVSAPEKMTAGRSRTYSGEAGSATLVVEARDSVTGALLGRAVDSRLAGDTSSMMMPRSTVSNRSDFRQLVERWAKQSVDGLNELKRLSPTTGG
jgi:hypothetical protein